MSAKLTISIATIALTLCNGLAAAQSAAQGDVDMTRFCARQGHGITRYYPQRAQESAQEGVVHLDCVMSGSAVRSCRVVDESNPNWGFGDAALRIACNFTLQRAPDGAMTVRHAPSESSISTDEDGVTHAHIPVRFRLQISSAPPPPHP